jgi:flagellar hook-associated protein 3 FlgL
MGVSPVNVTRVSHNLRAFNLLNTVRANHVSLFRIQNQLATGLRFNAPSEDPTRAADAIKLDRRMDILEQVERNLLRVNEVLREGESAMQQAVELVTEAHTLALSMAGDTASPGERESIRVVVESMLDQLITIGNRRHLDNYLFGGHYGADVPFELGNDGVLYRGDDGRLQTIVDSDLSEDTFTISGMEFFNAVSDAVQGFADLDPALTVETRLIDLNGATGSGVSTGRILVSDGLEQVEIDLTGCDTVGDVLDKLNAELPATLWASLSTRGIDINPTGTRLLDITVTDAGGGNTAVELGIHTDVPVRSVQGADVDPRLTLRTALADLNVGAGVDLRNGLTIRVGQEVASISFNGTETLEDVLNRINQSNIGVLAQIGADGKTIEVRNRVSGANMRIEENGGQAATALGIRSMYAGTRLADLNDGLGVDSLEDYDDIRITTADGTTIDIDLDDLNLATATLQDVIDLFNARGGGAISAALSATGNGITITDNTGGAGTLRIERLNLSPAIDGLGLDVTATGNTLVGRDVNPVKVDSAFTALLELRAALQADDSQAISAAGRRLTGNLDHMQEVQGKLAAKAAAMLERTSRVENETTATRVLQSDVRDVDLSEAIVRFQQVQTALQANLATASRIINLSLLDYLSS